MRLPQHCLHRVLKIGCGPTGGSAFLYDRIDAEGVERQYLITAAHVVAAISNAPVMATINGGWHDVGANLLAVDNAADVAVLSTRMPPFRFPTYAEPASLCIGDPVALLGFPLGIATTLANMPSVTLPLAKSGIISGNAGANFLLDITSVPGFSGGPIIMETAAGLAVAGVLTKRVNELLPVLDAHGAKTGFVAEGSAGIAVAAHIQRVAALIHSNPLGAPLPAAFGATLPNFTPHQNTG